MATILRQEEAEPASYPSYPGSPDILSAAAAAIDPAVVWERLEQYIAHRYSARDVVWIVEGPGEFVPPLALATIDEIAVWSCGAGEYEAVTLQPSPMGGCYLPASGPYRFEASVAAAEIPAPIWEAYRRLAEYMAAKPGKPGATSERVTAGSVSVSHSRSQSWIANALQNSGAADLLRPYRRA